MTISEVWRAIKANLVVFASLLLACLTVSFGQVNFEREAYVKKHGDYDPRMYYSYKEVFSFNFPEGYQPKAAYDQWRHVSTLEPLADLNYKLLNHDSCSAIMSAISQKDLNDINAEFAESSGDISGHPRFFVSETECVMPVEITTRDYDLVVEAKVPTSLEVAQLIAKSVEKKVKTEAAQIEGNPEIVNLRTEPVIQQASRKSESAAENRELLEFTLISIVVAVAGTALFSAGRAKLRAKFQKSGADTSAKL